MSANQQYVDLGKSGAGVTQNSGGSAVRWEQGTCNASFRDEAQKLRQKDQKSNGKVVSIDDRRWYLQEANGEKKTTRGDEALGASTIV